MTDQSQRVGRELTLGRVLALVFVPPALLMVFYMANMVSTLGFVAAVQAIL